MAEVEVKKDVPMEDDPVEKEQKRIKDEKALVLSGSKKKKKKS